MKTPLLHDEIFQHYPTFKNSWSVFKQQFQKGFFFLLFKMSDPLELTMDEF